MSRFSVPGPDPATLLLESSANTPLFLRSDGHSGETPSTKSITRSKCWKLTGCFMVPPLVVTIDPRFYRFFSLLSCLPSGARAVAAVTSGGERSSF